MVHPPAEMISNREFRNRKSLRSRKSSLGMAGVVYLDAFREQAFAPALPPARQGGAARFRLHARTKTVLAFACALR